MPKIIDAEYDKGRADSARGVTLRALVEPIVNNVDGYDPQREDREFSHVIGYFDAALQAVRTAVTKHP